MRNLLLFLLTISSSVSTYAQSTKPANVYPSNLDANMYFESYDDASSTIKGLNFMVLSDGNNSRDITPAFEVSVYLLPEGRTSREDVVIVKTYQLDGLYHMGKKEFNNENVSLAGSGIAPGNYRVGLWVNSNKTFEEDTNDNATLFRQSIKVNKTPSGAKSTKTEKKDTNDGWGSWDDDDDDGW